MVGWETMACGGSNWPRRLGKFLSPVQGCSLVSVPGTSSPDVQVVKPSGV